jgi:hypothetical protein
LPHKRYLQSISSTLHVSPHNEINTSNYPTHQVKQLSDRELYVSLLVDGIYVNQTLTFKAQNIIGSAENRPTQIAKTVLSFMITSAFGSYKEIVRLVPVSGLIGEELKKITIEVIQYVQSFNFKVIVVISDNNRVNLSMFKLFCETIVYYIISDRNASLYASENFDRRVRLRTSGTLLTSFIMAFRSRVIYDVLSYRCNYPKNEVSFN